MHEKAVCVLDAVFPNFGPETCLNKHFQRFVAVLHTQLINVLMLINYCK